MKMETTLIVTTENVKQLTGMDIACQVGDEFPATVRFEVNAADPQVGITTDDIQITGVECFGDDVTDLFDQDALQRECCDYRSRVMESMADDAERIRRDALDTF